MDESVEEYVDREVEEVDGEEEEVDEEYTAQNALLSIERAWLNEKFAPEILPHNSDLVECMLQQIAHMEENVRRLGKGDLRIMIHRMELDRIRFVISSYLRTRLEKIERYTVHILSQERTRDGADRYLTPAEHLFATEFLSSMENLFSNIALQYMPGNFQTFEVNKFSIKPNMEAYVFLRAKEKITDIMLPGELVSETINMEPGSQHILQYSAVADLVKSGAIWLI